MRIGIDVSQLAFEKTGVANYLKNLVIEMIRENKEHEYVLFFSSMRRNLDSSLMKELESSHVAIKAFRFPPTFLEVLWNKLHIVPIEWLIGPVDVFISSDWVQPPSKAKKVTILYDLIVYKHPEETAKRIIEVQKRRLAWVKKEVDKILCISEATKKDAMGILGISEKKLEVIYPGIPQGD